MKKILNKLLALMIMLMTVPLSGWAQDGNFKVMANSGTMFYHSVWNNLFDGDPANAIYVENDGSEAWVEFRTNDYVLLPSQYNMYIVGQITYLNRSVFPPFHWTLKAKRNYNDNWVVVSDEWQGSWDMNDGNLRPCDIRPEYVGKSFMFFRFEIDNPDSENGLHTGEGRILTGIGELNFACQPEQNHTFNDSYEARCKHCDHVIPHDHQYGSNGTCVKCGYTANDHTTLKFFAEDLNGLYILDSDKETAWEATISGGSVSTVFRACNPVALTSYSFVSGNGVSISQPKMPKSWTLYAKVKESDSWTAISTVNNAELPTLPTKESQKFEIADQYRQTEYTLFKLEVHSTGYDGELCLGGMKVDADYLNVGNVIVYAAQGQYRVDIAGTPFMYRNIGYQAFDNFEESTTDEYWAHEYWNSDEYIHYYMASAKPIDLTRAYSDIRVNHNWYSNGYGWASWKKEHTVYVGNTKSDTEMDANQIGIIEDGVNDINNFSWAKGTHVGKYFDYKYTVSYNAKFTTAEVRLLGDELEDTPEAPGYGIYSGRPWGNDGHIHTNLLDKNTSTTWAGLMYDTDDTNQTWVPQLEWELDEPAEVNGYTIHTGADANKTPTEWRLWGKESWDGQWQLLAHVKNANLSANAQSAIYFTDNDEHLAMKCLRFEICGVKSGNQFEVAEFSVIPLCATHDYNGTYSDRCKVCGYIRDHEHTDGDVCTKCGMENNVTISDYVGADTDRKNVQWTLNTKTGVLTFEGTGNMETYDLNHNGWKNSSTVVTTVVIGKGITKFGGSSYFSGCNSLTTLIYEDGTTAVIPVYAKQVTTVELPNTVTQINEDAFYNYIKLQTINLPDGLESIGDYAFSGANELTVTLPHTLKTIGQRAFSNALTNTELTIPASVTEIQKYAFQYCEVENIIFEGHPTLGDGAFSGLEYLNDVQLISETPINTANNVFGICHKNATLCVPYSLYDWAITTAPWNEFKEILTDDINLEIINANGRKTRYNLDVDDNDNELMLTDDLRSIRVFTDINMASLIYEREFTSNQLWQSLFVPFDIEMTDDVLAQCDIAIPYMVSTKGSADGGTLEGDKGLSVLVLMKLERGETALAGTPYFIRPKAAGALMLSLSGTILHRTMDTHTLSCATSTDRYEFVGQYAQGQPDTEDAWYAMTPEGTLALGGDNSNEIGALRWYMTKTSKSSNYPSAHAKALRIVTWGEEDEATAIVNAYVDSSADSQQGIYSITGVRLTKPQKGINIINGRKVVIK